MSTERFVMALDVLVADQSPRGLIVGLAEQERMMLRVAQLLRGSRAVKPHPAYIAHLRECLRFLRGA